MIIPIGMKLKIREDLNIDTLYSRNNGLSDMSVTEEMVEMAGSEVTIYKYEEFGDWYSIEEDTKKDEWLDSLGFTIDMFDLTKDQKEEIIANGINITKENFKLQCDLSDKTKEVKSLKRKVMWLAISHILLFVYRLGELML